MILVDTSILGRIAIEDDPLYEVAKRGLNWAFANGRPAVAAQSIYEFWVLATRPVAQNGLGWPPDRVAAWIQTFRQTCQFLPENPKIFDVWLSLVSRHSTKGKSAHDARLAACMNVNGIRKVLTFNIKDFTRYGITVVDPRCM